jgi:hypothetical protein
VATDRAGSTPGRTERGHPCFRQPIAPAGCLVGSGIALVRVVVLVLEWFG